ncbi:hypothetical protein ACEPAH_2101 [Sanghuangporus vaninii]
MKNGLDSPDDIAQQPPSKKIKLEEDPVEEGRLLSQKRHGKGGRKSKSTIEERALVLLNDDRISAVEPQQVLCRMCGHWVKLFKHTDFSPANWRTHAEKCESRSRWRARIRADPGLAFTLTIPSVNPDRPLPAPESISAPAAPAVATSATHASDSARDVQHDNDDTSDDDSNEPLEVDAMLLPQKRVTKTTEDRRRELENDARCENPGPHSVLCKMCGQWVRLHNTREYDLWNWLRHAEKCEVRNGWVKAESAGLRDSNAVSKALGESASSSEQSSRLENRENSDTLHSGKPSMQGARELRRRMSISQTSRPVSYLALWGRTATAILETDRPEKPRSLGKARATETRSEQRDLSTDHSENVSNMVRVPASTKRSQKSPSRAVDLIKPEPNGSDHFLFYSPPGLKAEDDEASASASTSMKRRKGRTAEERKQALLSDPRAGQVLPNEVFCNMCKKWIKLYKEVEYVESNWIRHAERCSVRVAAKTSPKARVSDALVLTSASFNSLGKRSPMKTDEERLRDLQADPRIEAIEPQQVLCRICKQWIKLQLYRNYDIWNWRKHIPLCEQRHPGTDDGSSRLTRLRAQPSESNRLLRSVKAEELGGRPSSGPSVPVPLTAPPAFSSSAKSKDETSVEERRAILEKDGRCQNIEPQRVTCKLCQRVVGLHVKKDYSLSNWYKHVASCDKVTGKSSTWSIKAPLTVNDTSRPAAISTEQSTPTQALPDDGTNDGTKAAVDEVVPNRDEEVQLIASAPPHVNKPPKSTPAERRAKLLADSRVEAVEPNRIRCRLCQHWLKLNEFMEYAPYNWYKHIERCLIRTNLRFQGTAQEPIFVKEEEVEVPEVKDIEEPSTSSDGGSRKRTTPAERLARMQADPRIKVIEKHRARCGVCDKWVKLQNKTEYDPHNWFAHIKKCAEKPNAVPVEQTVAPPPVEKREPSPIVIGDSDTERTGNSTVLGRRALLLNDLRVTAVEPHRVLCGICNQWIKLRDGKDYVPYNWFKHKRKCEKRHGLTQLSVPPNEEVSSPAAVKKEPESTDMVLHNHGQRKFSDEEREARLRADPRLSGVEPGRVFCKMCDSWIRLNMATGFLPGNWLRHAQRCKGKASWQGATPEYTEEPPELSALEVIDLEYDGSSGHFGFIELGRLIGKFEPTVSSTDYGNPTESKLPSAIAPASTKQPPSVLNLPTLRARPGNSRLNSPAPMSLSQHEMKIQDPGKRMHRTEEERKQELESDPRTKIVHPEKILCRMCDRWIQMRRDVSYSPQNWLKHAGICEQRTGWMKKHDTEVETNGVLSVVENVAEELMPYNARKRLEEKEVNFEPPPLKPVDWGQIVTSDDDDDDDEHSNVDNVVPSTGKMSTSQGSDQRPMSRLENPSTNGAPNAASTPKMSVPTPLAAWRANKADLKANTSSTSANVDLKKPVSASPPVVAAPFTTIPLPFYRTPYAPHMVRHGFPESKDGVPPKSASPKNGSSQRSIPFVVPAPSMLPHLLPRPVLVPISHTSRHVARTVSPLSLPRTPPVPPVGSTKGDGVPHMHSLSPPQGSEATNGFGSPQTGNPARPDLAKASGSSRVAVPTPVKPVDGMTTETNAEKSIVLPKETGRFVSQRTPDIQASSHTERQVNLAADASTVLQLGPRKDLPLESDRTNMDRDRDNATVELMEVAFQAKSIPDVLQLGPRVDLPGPVDRPREKRTSESSVSDASVPSGNPILAAKTIPSVLQLVPNPEELHNKETQNKQVDVVQMDQDVTMTEERLDAPEGAPMTVTPKQDAMLVDA